MLATTPQPEYVQFRRVRCYKCAIPFWVPEVFNQDRHRLGDSFYCPAGHGQVYSESDAEKEAKRLRAMLADSTRNGTYLLTRLGAAQTERDKLSRKLKRVGRGVCPDCNRTFQNLGRHMACKHAK